MSVSTSESQAASRPSTSDPSLQSGPIPLFEHHLKLLTDSYLSFFQERKRIEEVYVDSLLKLHRKVKAIDGFLDERYDQHLNTARRVWSEIRDNVERESQTRQAFLTMLTIDVINPLITLKETQERTRKRIKEDIKESSSAYTDYAENTLPKLKRTYLKKCQDVEDHKTTTSAPSHSDTPYSNSNDNAMNSSRSNPSLPVKPVVSAPEPLRPLDRRPSSGLPSAHSRTPSTSTAFSDLAHHGKKQLNQFITFLDKSATVTESLSGRADNSALRLVRAKREANEADKEYRKSVHWLETLRLRRTKILEGAYKSLETFLYDHSMTVKTVLEQYVDNMTATTMTQTRLSSDARSMVNQISPQKDVSAVGPLIERSLASASIKPVLYYNYSVGECSDLIFGVSLVDYATARNLDEGEIPKIVRICINEIDQRGLKTEGIYRVSGRHAVVQELQHKIERSENDFQFNPLPDDVHAVSSLLKMYLRELSEPLFRFSLHDRIEHTEDRVDHQSNNFAVLRSKIRRLPPVHRATLKAIVKHLARVSAFSEKNKMDPKNLAIIFGGVIFGEDDFPKGGDLLNVQPWKDTTMEDLIVNASVIFDERPTSSLQPLPSVPVGEPTPTYLYGSSHTRVGSVPPRLFSPGTPGDFTPPLPNRPTGSIHPSMRANPVSPTHATMDAPGLPPRSPRLQTAVSTSQTSISTPVTPVIDIVDDGTPASSTSQLRTPASTKQDT